MRRRDSAGSARPGSARRSVDGSAKHVGTQPYRRCATLSHVTTRRGECRPVPRCSAARSPGHPPRPDAGARRGRLRPALDRGGRPPGRCQQDRHLPALALQAGAGAGDRRPRWPAGSCRCRTPAASAATWSCCLQVMAAALQHPLASQIIPDLLAEAARNPAIADMLQQTLRDVPGEHRRPPDRPRVRARRGAGEHRSSIRHRPHRGPALLAADDRPAPLTPTMSRTSPRPLCSR